jgi:alkylation response protein AidB-like acyl-CoA dehydrogenase
MTTLDDVTTLGPQAQGEVRERLLQTARDLRPLLREHAGESERNRRLAENTERALRESGLFQATAPRRSGGAGGDVRTLIELSAEISRGDSSAGWVAFIANTTAFGMGLFPDDVRELVYGPDPRNVAISQFAPGGTAEKVDGGYRINGKWGFASGCYQAQWTLNAFLVLDAEGQPSEVRWALMPLADMRIEDTWYVVGMAGTGSNTLVAEDLFVEDRCTLDLETFMGTAVFPIWHEDETSYRASLNSLACLGLCGPLLGMAEDAWDFTTENLGKGRPVSYWAYSDRRDAPSYRLALADARVAIDAGRMHLLRSADEMDDAAREGRVLDTAARARIRGDSEIATRNFRRAVTLMLDIVGTSSFAQSNPLQRVWRDLTVASGHGLNNPLLNREIYGQSLVGRDTAEIGSL